MISNIYKMLYDIKEVKNMIMIEIRGLDQYVIGHYAKDVSSKIANLYEVDEDMVNFYAPESFIIHKGVEQTSWNALIIVRAPDKYKYFQDKVAHFLLETTKDFIINVAVEFDYYDEKNHYERINHEYPRYISETNMVNLEIENEEEQEEDNCSCEEHESNSSIYEGNTFKDFDKKNY